VDAVLPHAHFDRCSVEVARDLLGRRLAMPDGVVLQITETEAYRFDDTACHAHKGRTVRTAPMFGPPGHLYVYLCYGIHHLLNLVTEAEGTAGCVLIRGCTVTAGHALVHARRGGPRDLGGPGKVGQALGLDVSWSGRPLATARPLDGMAVLEGKPVERFYTTPRIGIDYAEPADRDRPWRFVAGTLRRRRARG